ncbi:MAG: methylenetetrahydrofolate reductase [NAD(P)H] [Deltaproteobacteria bacterium]|nr:methylenetetrahydrofolate reductase [NAD(P)H] [Deltaproteobacteria bacterium]
MKIADLLKTRKKGFSFEFFPPKTEAGMVAFLQVVRELSRLDPLYVSVTYGAGGSTQDRTLKTLRAIRENFSLTVMSHLTCIGATRASMATLLQTFREEGIENVLALRGDPPEDIPDFDPSAGEFPYGRDLAAFVRSTHDFSIAVAVYPEGHLESPSLEADLIYTKEKVDAGADFAITQMFFDNRYFFAFRERAERAGLRLPIFPGIMPITDLAKVKRFASFCGATIPAWVEEKMAPLAGRPEEMEKVGVEIAIRQCEELLEQGVSYLHFYTLNRSDAVVKVVEALQGRFFD